MRARFPRPLSSQRVVRGGAPQSLLQRKCDCGTHTGGGECESCAERKRSLQRQARGDADEVPEIVHQVLAQPGSHLDTDTRGFMQDRFGRDFSDVRVHTDSQAARSAQAVQAHAYTVGPNIVFAPGRYAPTSSAGRHLLAHELAHVAQQDGTATAAGEITLDDRGEGEADADRAADRVMSGEAAAPSANAAGLQRQTSEAAAASGESARAGSGGACIEEVVGEDIPSLLEAGALTIVEFGAPWCGPCQQNLGGLREACQRLQAQPPGAAVRFYTINIDAEGNEGAYESYVPGGIPHLYVYVGNTLKAHYTTGIEPDAMQSMIDEHVAYASTSGATRGARSGALWGMIPGAAVGIGGAIALGVAGEGMGLSGNAVMGAALGSIAGGVALGAGIGAGIGAIAGAAGDDRGRGPRQQRRRRLQRKANTGSHTPMATNDDNVAAHGAGAPLDAGTRDRMQRTFGQDFSAVRVHRDKVAARTAAAFDAHAVTQGQHILFAADAPPPSAPGGDAVLGHELAHVAQNAMPGAAASAAALEEEARRSASDATHGRATHVRLHNDGTPRPLTRGEQTAVGAAAGGGGGAVVGATIGLIAAAASGGDLGAAAGIGALIGLGAGALIGAIVGFAVRRTSPETPAETEMLIRRRYGQYLGASVPAPLRNAAVHVVSDSEMCQLHNCRANTPGQTCEGLLGWTDTGPLGQPASGRYPPRIAAADEPVCDGRRLEHATPERPVIYYNGTAGTLVHEALHAYSHPDYQFLNNYVAEGTTEWFTRRLLDDINMPHHESAYRDEVVDAAALADDVGEEVLARAYFGGAMAELHHAFNARHGRCALISWAWSLQMGSPARAAEILQGGADRNYCDVDLAGYRPAELTPGEDAYRPPQPAEPAAESPQADSDE